MQCTNCLLLGNYYYDSEDYPLQVIKTHQSLKGSSNEPWTNSDSVLAASKQVRYS